MGAACVIHWFRRDLRLHDNTALEAALQSGLPVLPLFIFDTQITDELLPDDARISFIYEQLQHMHAQGCQVLIRKGDPVKVFKALLEEFEVKAVYANRDYEPYGRERDKRIASLLVKKGVAWTSYKDQAVFEEGEVVKKDGKPYTVFTPYSKRWREELRVASYELRGEGVVPRVFIGDFVMPSLGELGFVESGIRVRPYNLEQLGTYDQTRDYPSRDAGTYLGPHLRFGTVSIREVVKKAQETNAVFLSELIWREFFMQILWHYPEVVHSSFKKQYDGIPWRNHEGEFERWCAGKTGYPLVDAGMRELRATGYMHNRVRMVTASFLCKHLLIDWRWGEAWFAKHLLDYELSSNNGNWQWAAGTGCDAAPYFRVFNPMMQQEKFDPQLKYVKKWIPEFGTNTYPRMMVDHKMARERAISTYKQGLLPG